MELRILAIHMNGQIFPNSLKFFGCESVLRSIKVLCSQQYAGITNFRRVKVCSVSGLLPYPDWELYVFGLFVLAGRVV